MNLDKCQRDRLHCSYAPAVAEAFERVNAALPNLPPPERFCADVDPPDGIVPRRLPSGVGFAWSRNGYVSFCADFDGCVRFIGGRGGSVPTGVSEGRAIVLLAEMFPGAAG